MSYLTPKVQHSMQCSTGESCTRRAPGHGVSPMQLLASGATPSKWRDAFVTQLSSKGWFAVEYFEAANDAPDAAGTSPSHATPGTVWLWSHTATQLEIGTPVALHPLYSTLAVGAQRISVVLAGALD